MEIINPESMLQIKSELIVNMNEQKSLSEYKTPSYTLRAVRNYQQRNKEKLNEYAKKKKERYQNDPEFREQEKKKAMERYYRKKQETQNNV